ncbi:trypsin-like peptidase domain-containing protein [bacterium]|nr:trypsin-like peptidase domain-containing protein [bacterium]
MLFYQEPGKKQTIEKPDVEIFESVKTPVPAAPPETQSSISNSRSNAVTTAVAEVSPAVVGINVISVERYIRKSRDPFFDLFFPPRIIENEVKGLGSGFIISSDGYIVTNEHVIHNADKIVVTTTKGDKYTVEDYWSDKVTDIALLKIKGDNFPYIKMGDSDDIIVGEWAIALGNPYGLFDYNNNPSVTVGVISAIDRDFSVGKDNRVYQDMIQTDASINSGNSGGPLVNSSAEVIGMNTFIFTSNQYSQGSIGLGFAIPINKAKKIINDLEKYGKIDRNVYDGMHFYPISRYLMQILDLKTNKGIVVAGIENSSPAEKAGIKVGDVVIEFNGKKIDNFDDYKKSLLEGDIRPNDIVSYTILRENKKYTISLKFAPPKK